MSRKIVTCAARNAAFNKSCSSTISLLPANRFLPRSKTYKNVSGTDSKDRYVLLVNNRGRLPFRSERRAN